MDNSLLASFIEKYNRDTSAFKKRFEELDSKIQMVDQKFTSLDKTMVKLDQKLCEIESAQNSIFGQIGGLKGNLENLHVYLTSLETKLNEYETLHIHGEKTINGELYVLKVELSKVKPIVSWENDSMLTEKYKQITQRFRELEEICNC